MRAQFSRILDRYGQRVTLTIGNTEQETRAFLQPIRKQTEDFPLTATPIGMISRQRWLYLGSPAHLLSPGDRVRHGSLSLLTQEAHPIRLGESILCCRAVLRQEKEADK